MALGTRERVRFIDLFNRVGPTLFYNTADKKEYGASDLDRDEQRYP